MFVHAISATDASNLASTTELLNAQTLTAHQIRAALEVLAALPAEIRNDPAAQAHALQAYAVSAGLGDAPVASAALHARITALSKWTAAHDPNRQSNAKAVIEATARFPLIDGDDGIGFDPVGFQEMILFIEELPW